MQRDNQFLTVLLMFLIMASIVFAYSPMIFDAHYQGEDYMFLSQITRYGFLKAILISWKDHFLPLYRLIWGGLHLIFGNAVSIRIAILVFHLLNVALIFHIVRIHTKSAILPAIASVTFGLSNPVASSIVWCINGHWGMSLSFILLMGICFEKCLRVRIGITSQPDFTAVNSAPPAEQSESAESGSNRSAKERAGMKYYYAGLIAFVIALGFFTISIAGGTVLWFFLYVRLFRSKVFEKNVWHHLKFILPFAAIIAFYLLMRSYFNARSQLFQDAMTRIVASRPDLSLMEGLDVFVNPLPGLYLTAMEKLLPYFSNHSLIVLGLFALLFIKEIVIRKKEILVVFMWLTFAILTLALAVIGRVYYIFKGVGFVETLLFPWYFCYPIAGVSIALGLILRPTPSMERWARRSSALTRAALFVCVIFLLSALNVNNLRNIRINTTQIGKQNERFHRLVMRYRDSMKSFLQSDDYSPNGDFLFVDSLVDNEKMYPLNWAVTQRDIFNLYFPHITNIEFVGPWTILNERATLRHYYIWTSESIAIGST